MTTLWTDQDGERVVAVTACGPNRQRRVELQVRDEAWAQVTEVTSESGETVSRQQLESRGTVVSWTRFRANRLASDLEGLARTRSSWQSVAHLLLSRAQELRQEARQW